MLLHSVIKGCSWRPCGSLIIANYNRYFASYVQGQEPEPKIREYFYYIDHHGMLYLDDARIKNFTSCFKEKKFLHFFFTRLQFNNTNRYQDTFPYLSICGKERNFIRCDDLPIVYTHVKTVNDEERLFYAYAADLSVPFEPSKIYMSSTGRIYHPAPKKFGEIGLMRSKLAVELSKYFQFKNGEDESPTEIMWNSELHALKNDWLKDIPKFKDF